MMSEKETQSGLNDIGKATSFSSTFLKDVVPTVDSTPELFPDQKDTASWFGGVLEAGATASIGVSNSTDKSGHQRIKTLPYVEIHTSSQPMLDRLHRTYGGMRKPKFWSKGGKLAAELVGATFPFTIGRQEHALAMKNWLLAENLDEQIAIARDLKGREWQQTGDLLAYRELVKNPAFVAGALDSRAYIATRNLQNDHTLTIHMGSKNIPLLNALRSIFGGQIRIAKPAGTQVKHGDNIFQTKVDTFSWVLLGSEAIELCKFVADFVQTPLPERWDFKRSVELHVERIQFAQTVAKKAMMELQQVQAGELGKPSSDEELAANFGKNIKTIKSLLEKVLTPAEQKIRRDTIDRYSKQSTDAVLDRQIVAFIQEELSALQSGETERISQNNELAQKFGVSARVLSRILDQLPPDMRSVRLTKLRSQITHERHILYRSKKQKKVL